MKRLQIGYFFREGVRGVFLHGFMSFAAMGVIVACLLIMGSVWLIAFNIDHIIREVESSNEISVYVDKDLSEAEAKSVGTRIRLLDNVEDSIFVSRDEALTQYGELLGDEKGILEGIGDRNPLRHRFRVILRDVSQMADTKRLLEAVEGVAEVQARLDISEGIIALRGVVQAVSAVLIVVLSCVSVFIISNTVKLATYDRREEIGIMRIVGATNSFIRWPFVVEGLLLGFLGSVIAFFLQWSVYAGMVKRVGDGLPFLTVVPFVDIFYPMLAAFIMTGFLVGVGGSVLTIRKFLRV